MMTATGAPSTVRQKKSELGATAIAKTVHVLLVANKSGDVEAVHALLSRPEYGAFTVTHVSSLGDVPGAIGV